MTSFTINSAPQLSRFLRPTALLFTLLGSVAAFGGPGLSGGGQGIVCRDAAGIVTSARVLDLAEAEEFYLLKLRSISAKQSYLEIAKLFAAQLDQAAPAVGPISSWSQSTAGKTTSYGFDVNVGFLMNHHSGEKFMTDEVVAIDKSKMLIPGNDFKITALDDSHPRIQPSSKSCGIEQIAIYTDGNRQVHFVSSVWNKLNNVHKAALLIHEALYRALRVMGETNSDRTRKTVAYLFGGMKFDWLLDSVPNDYLVCWTEDVPSSSQFVVVPNGANSVLAYFLVYQGEIMLTKTVGIFDSAPFAQTLRMSLPKGNSTPSNQQTTTVIRQLQNPLLEFPTYNFSVTQDPTTGVFNGALEVVSLSGGKNEKLVSCNKNMSHVEYGADGSVRTRRAEF